MSRRMIDTTHQSLPAALPAILRLQPGDVVAAYDTGGAGSHIEWTPADLAEIPASLNLVMIDQGFADSPNLHATVRDCENGAWDLARAVNRTGWVVPRPTLYLGYPDTVTQAYQFGWRGDVWVAHQTLSAPASPPAVPAGINVVAQQWNYDNPEFDESVVFDATWPKGGHVSQPTVPIPVLQEDWAWCSKCSSLFYAPFAAKSVCAAGGQHEDTGTYHYLLPGLTKQ